MNFFSLESRIIYHNIHYHLLGYKFMYRLNVVLIQINSFGHEIFLYILFKMPLDMTSCNGLVKKTGKSLMDMTLRYLMYMYKILSFIFVYYSVQ